MPPNDGMPGGPMPPGPPGFFAVSFCVFCLFVCLLACGRSASPKLAGADGMMCSVAAVSVLILLCMFVCLSVCSSVLLPFSLHVCSLFVELPVAVLVVGGTCFQCA